MAKEKLYVENSVLELLLQVDRWNLKHKQVCASFTNFFYTGPLFIFEGCPGYPEKIYEKTFRQDWDHACAFMIEHNVLENRSWPGHNGHNGSLLYAERLRELLARTEAKTELPRASTSGFEKLFWMKKVLEFTKNNSGLYWYDLRAWFPKSKTSVAVIGGDLTGDKQSMQAWAEAYDNMVAAGAVKLHMDAPGLPSPSDHYTVDAEILQALVAHYEKPTEPPPVKMGGLFGDIGDIGSTVNGFSLLQTPRDASEKLAMEVPVGATIHPVEQAHEIEAKVQELRARLHDLFNQSIRSGPMPHRVVIHIIEQMLGEYGSSDEFATRAGDFFAEAKKIGKNPIRYTAWLHCSELLSKARAVVKGLTPEIDGCMIDEYESAIRNLTKAGGI